MIIFLLALVSDAGVSAAATTMAERAEAIEAAERAAEAGRARPGRAGVLLEAAAAAATDTNLRLLIVIAAATPISVIGHGLFSDNPVIGASGYVYAVLVYQIALLLKNWREMRTRASHPNARIEWRATYSSSVVRLIFAIVLLVTEIVLSQYTTVSKGGHLFGALTGLFVGLAVGSNVTITIDVWEILLPWFGVCGLLALLMVGVATNQIAATLFGWIAMPIVIFYAARKKAPAETAAAGGSGRRR